MTLARFLSFFSILRFEKRKNIQKNTPDAYLFCHRECFYSSNEKSSTRGELPQYSKKSWTQRG